MAAMAAAMMSSSSSSSTSMLVSVAAGSRSSPTSSSLRPALAPLRRSRAPVTQHRRRAQAPSALFGGDEKGTSEKKPEKKFITREEEPEQYWKSEAEKDGKNPMQTVLPYIALLTLLSPFAILALAYTQGWIKGLN